MMKKSLYKISYLFLTAATLSAHIHAYASDENDEIDNIVAAAGLCAGHSSTGQFKEDQLIDITSLIANKKKNESEISLFGAHENGIMLDPEHVTNEVKKLQAEYGRNNLELSSSNNFNKIKEINNHEKENEASFLLILCI